MKMRDIRELCLIFANSHAHELELVSEHSAIKLKKSGQQTPRSWPPAAPESIAHTEEQREFSTIKSPGVGLFLATHPATPNRALTKASTVAKGDIVAFLQVGLLLLPIISDVEGLVEDVLVKPSQMVDFSAPLFTVQLPKRICA